MPNETATPAASPAPAAPAAPAAPPASPAAPAAPAPAAPPASPAAPAAPAATPSEAEKQASAELAKLTGAPEKYEIKDSEGKPVEGEHVAKFTDFARKLNLSQEGAQKLVEMNRELLNAQNAQVQAQVTEFYSDIGGLPDTWKGQLTADKEIGGEALNANLALAAKVIDAFGDKDGQVKKLFDKTQIGNHPALTRLLVRVGRAISEDKLVTGGNAPAPAERSAKDFFPNSNMNA